MNVRITWYSHVAAPCMTWGEVQRISKSSAECRFSLVLEYEELIKELYGDGEKEKC